MATIADGKGTICLAAFDSKAELKKHEIGRPEPEGNEVAIDIEYAGICHSDLHTVNGDWGVNLYPLTPGHEIAGKVTKVGPGATKFKVGDRVGVGCMVGSCRNCGECERGLQQHCTGMVQTYSSQWKEDMGHPECAGHWTNGGYSQRITVAEDFVFSIPDALESKYAAPLLCAGITTYSPLNRHLKGKKGIKVAVVGFGGLGHVAVKIAKAMGAERVAILSRSKSKQKEAEAIGAELIAHTDPEEMKANFRQFDVVLDTAAADHDYASILPVLKVGGTLVVIGGVPTAMNISSFALIFSQHKVEGSLIGGVPETAEMLAFCAEHNIVPDIEVIHAKDAPAAYESLKAGSVAKRHVIDATTLSEL